MPSFFGVSKLRAQKLFPKKYGSHFGYEESFHGLTDASRPILRPFSDNASNLPLYSELISLQVPFFSVA